MKKTVTFLLLFVLWVTPVAAQVVPQSTQQMQLSFAPLVKQAGPAVVNIYTKRVIKERARVFNPFFNDPFFNQFFGGGFRGPVRERIDRSLGSGVILDAGGLVVTNHHVVKQAEEITVITSEGNEFTAKKVLADEKTDLVVLKLDIKNKRLPVLQMADSDALQVGDLVLAIGNPFGVGQTVTSGIVSGLARTDVGIADYGFFIQTDAAINPGNSGGALIDMQGRLVGVNTAIFSRDGGSSGIGFAIPSAMVRTVLHAAKSGGKLVRPWTGIGSQDVTPDMLESLGLKKAQGTMLVKVHEGSPADKAGLKVGDVILAIDEKPVQDAKALRFRLATVPLGSRVTLDVWRQGKTMQRHLITAAPPEIPPRQATKIEGNSPLSGITVANISPAVIEEMGALSKNEGVVVYNIEDGAALRFGFRVGDIIIALNGKEISSVDDLLKAVRKKAHVWKFTLGRDGQLMSITLSE